MRKPQKKPLNDLGRSLTPFDPNHLARKHSSPSRFRQIEKARLEQLKETRKTGPNLMVLVLMRVIGIGIETADNT